MYVTNQKLLIRFTISFCRHFSEKKQRRLISNCNLNWHQMSFIGAILLYISICRELGGVIHAQYLFFIATVEINQFL